MPKRDSGRAYLEKLYRYAREQTKKQKQAEQLERQRLDKLYRDADEAIRKAKSEDQSVRKAEGILSLTRQAEAATREAVRSASASIVKPLAAVQPVPLMTSAIARAAAAVRPLYRKTCLQVLGARGEEPILTAGGRLVVLREIASKLTPPEGVSLRPEDWLWPVVSANRRDYCWFERIKLAGRVEHPEDAGWWLCVPAPLLPSAFGGKRMVVRIVTAPVEPDEEPHTATVYGPPALVDEEWDGVERFAVFTVYRHGIAERYGYGQFGDLRHPDPDGWLDDEYHGHHPDYD